MSTAIRRSLPLALLLLLLGCGRSFNYEGSWWGNRNIKDPTGTEPALYASIGRVTLKIKGSRFEMTNSEIPTEGNVEYQGDRARLVPDTIFRRPMEQQAREVQFEHPPVEVIGKEDGTLVLMDPRAVDGKPLVLRRG